MAFTTKATIASFGGRLLKLTHHSSTVGCEMAVNLYLPPQASSRKVPVLYYLAGLTCTGDNGAEKGGFQAAASRRGVAVCFPDTSPRGLKLAGEDDAYDFGTGAGFYLTATKAPYKTNYNMYSYITSELPRALASSFSAQLDTARASITGHSMGGHGALTLYLKNPGLYKSVSAFAPIANPTKCPWGEKAFGGYLGGGVEEGKEWDATELVGKFEGRFDALIDVGTGDDFFKQGQLRPEAFQEAVGKRSGGGEVKVRFQEGYDHSYYFISTFAGEHVEYAADALGVW